MRTRVSHIASSLIKGPPNTWSIRERTIKVKFPFTGLQKIFKKLKTRCLCVHILVLFSLLNTKSFQSFLSYLCGDRSTSYVSRTQWWSYNNFTQAAVVSKLFARVFFSLLLYFFYFCLRSSSGINPVFFVFQSFWHFCPL